VGHPVVGQAAAQAGHTAAGFPAASAGKGWNIAIYALLGLILLIAVLILVNIAGQLLRPYFLGSTGDRGEKLLKDAIAQLQQGPTPDARREAVKTLLGIGPAAVVQALDAATPASADPSAPSLRRPVNQALAEAGAPVVEALIRALGHPRQDVRIAAADVLKGMGPQAAPAVPALAHAAGDPNRWMRVFACTALGNIGPGAAGAVDALLQAARHEDPFTRRQAIAALGRIGVAARKAIPMLTQEAGDQREKADVREAAVLALYQVDLQAIAEQSLAKAPQEIRELVQRLNGNDPFEAVEAAKTLARKKAQARPAIPALARALERSDKWIREAAANALGEMGHDAKVVRPALEKAAGDPEREVREAAQRALEKTSGAI
jgi:HEAT repeat protein